MEKKWGFLEFIKTTYHLIFKGRLFPEGTSFEIGELFLDEVED